MNVITAHPQPHRRTPDLTRMTPAQRAELKAFIARLERAGGYSPAHIRRVLSPAEEQRLIELERLVSWAPCDPARGAERPAVAAEHAKGVSVLMPERVARKRRLTAVSDLQDAVARLALIFDDPVPATIDPQRDPEGLHRLEGCARYLTQLAGQLESQPVYAQGA